MKTLSLKSVLIPIIALTICVLIFQLGYFQMIPVALLLLLASFLEHKKNGFRFLGFQRKNLMVKNLLLWAPLCGVLMFMAYAYLILPLVTQFTGQTIDLSAFDVYEGDVVSCLVLLVYIWSSAAFAEEIVFRGYLMQQFIKFFGSSTLSVILNILLLGLLFGFVHSYQGITGQIVAGITGMILAIIFHLRKSDLWFNIVVHGSIDTVAVLYFYYGWI
ncbi:CPBP family intramembrane glutamic endopeptidase [Nonlabens xiamenensis]|uniref:CPBP family intramembrane glutamic endopeptidase n=1 Tax=Nonlabens xiamenensis TaxID=2341043 RepID=UPI000F60F8BD|nr:CPBP family intramembrane glutamic endopeptidase [Nonlabens xiamenensis]